MSMSLGGGGGSRYRRAPMSEINVTPFVDVMLVLLVILMITAPALEKEGIDVDLPRAKGDAASSAKIGMPWSLTIDSSGRVFIGGKKIEPADVPTQLPPLLQGHEKDMLTVNGDGRLSYDTVMKVVSVIRRSGVKAINLAVQGLHE